jgi:hypothetical protein
MDSVPTGSLIRRGPIAAGMSLPVIGLLMATGVFACRGGQQMTNAEASAQERDVSLSWVDKVMALKEVRLPDEWYQVSGADTGKRIDGMLRLIDSRKDLSPAEKSDLLRQLENDGKPFIHRIFFNRPMPPGAPGDSPRGEGLITVVSMKNRASVAIELSEIRDVREQRVRFSPARIKELESVFR